MVKNNESKILITSRNIKHYSKIGLICSIGEVISVDIDTLPKKSHNKVIAICELCSSETELYFSKYNENKDRQGFYSCKKCSNKKRKNSILEKYGVECILQTDDIKSHNKEWMSSDEFRLKSKKKILKVYGVEHFSKTDEFKTFISNKVKNHISYLKENDLYICPLSLPSNKDLKENGMFNKYGHTYSIHVPEIKSKIQSTNLEKFGSISPFGNPEIQSKIKIILLEKFGHDNPFKVKSIQDKIKQKNLNKYQSIDTEAFLEYRKYVRFYTNRNRKRVFENWNGCDFYDGEYIRDFTSMGHNHIKYPTIDHKVSCINGFKNNISPIEISDISNLCITKRIINSKKSHLNADEFYKIIKSFIIE